MPNRGITENKQEGNMGSMEMSTGYILTDKERAGKSIYNKVGDKVTPERIEDPLTANISEVSSYIDFTNITTPGNPLSTRHRVYSKTTGSDTNIYVLDSGGTELELASTSNVAPDLDGAYDNGSDAILNVDAYDVDFRLTAPQKVEITNSTGSTNYLLVSTTAFTVGAIPATFGSTLGVTGATTLSSTLDVTGAATLSSTLDVTGATTLSSTLDVTGTTSLNGDVNVGNAAGDTITILGATTINGSSTAATNIHTGSNNTLTIGSSSSGSASLNTGAGLTLGANATSVSIASSSVGTTINGSLTVTQATVFTGATTHNSVTTLNGTIAANGNVTTNLTINQSLEVRGFIGTDIDTATISTGVITATSSFMSVDTEGAAATDDLDTINGGTEGAVLIVQAANSARSVVAKDATGNLQLNGDFTMDHQNDKLLLVNIGGTEWHEISRSNNA